LEVVVVLDLDTARNIVKAVSADVSCRGVIEGPDFPAIVTDALESWHWAGGVRNFALILAGMGPEDAEFVRVSCVGIAEVTQGVVFAETRKGKLPKVRTSRTTQRTVNGFVHSATCVSMKDGTDYVFDWWPTLNPKNPLISAYPQWLIAGTTIENRYFRGLT
jgi:hypothetical protein